MQIPLWGWFALAYLAIGVAVLKSFPLSYLRVRVARNYAHCCLKFYRSVRRDPWRSRAELREIELLVRDAVDDADFLLEQSNSRSAIETLLFWPEEFRQAIITAWDANALCDERREGVAKRLSQRNLRLGRV
jgi:hypothetical protein